MKPGETLLDFLQVVTVDDSNGVSVYSYLIQSALLYLVTHLGN